MSDEASSPGDPPRPDAAGTQPMDAAAIVGALQMALAAGLSALEAAGAGLAAAQAPPAAAGDASIAPDLAPFVGRAMLAAAGSSARYLRDLAALCGKHQGSLLRVVGAGAARHGLTGQECRVAADELRAFLREAGDTAALEAHRLQIELAALSEAVADIAARDMAPDPQPTRRWRAKP